MRTNSTTLLKTVSVLTRSHVIGDAVVFSNIEPDVAPEDTDPRSWKSIILNVEAWHDLGDVESITVTVEPGDRLNA